MTVREFNPGEQYYGDEVVYKVQVAEFNLDIDGWDTARLRVETTFDHSRPLYYEMPLFCIWTAGEIAA